MLLKRYIETLPNGPSHNILKAGDDQPLDNTPDYKVPPGDVFAMGDNRDNSRTAASDERASASCRWRTWSAAPTSSSSRSTPPIRGGRSGSGRSRSAGRACSRGSPERAPPCRCVGHDFARPALLREALTHRSAVPARRGERGRSLPATGAGSNERLEFIGDRVLGLLIAEWLAERFPDEQEGALGPRLAHLVSQPALAAIAARVGLPALLAVAAGEARAGVRKPRHGAGGRAGGADRRALSRWRPGAGARLRPPRLGRDAMDGAGRAAQGRQDGVAGMGAGARPGPAALRTGQRATGPPHAPVFVIAVEAAGGGAARGGAGSKRAAERLAAADLLAQARAMTTRCGFVAIVGAPNAGKSTLLNRLTGAKLSIVSPKAQTTRMRVLGILMRGEAQVLLVDTPGIFRPRRRLDRAMVAAAWTGAADADLVLLLVDAKAGLTEQVREIAARLAERGGGAVAGAQQDRPGAAADACCR